MTNLNHISARTVPSSTNMRNWIDSISGQVRFAQRRSRPTRTDGEHDWRWFEKTTSYRRHVLIRRFRPLLDMLGLLRERGLSLRWFREHADDLWETRCLLADDLSRLLFDSSLALRMTDHRQFYFPRIDFDDLVEVGKFEPFSFEDLPTDYLGLPLQLCDVLLRMPSAAPVALRIICTDQMIDGLNHYRQYLTCRSQIDVSPTHGDVVLDCGACIGDYSLLFAAMVGVSGRVDAFDPLPLHNRYCRLQMQLNPTVAARMHFNELAVGARSKNSTHHIRDCTRIDPGHRVDEDAFDVISIDDYVKQYLGRVDFIKMDIEGAEMDAICGAALTIATFKPRLAISGYHKPNDLWDIPRKLKELNPNYRITFGHHSPVQWESVFYATNSELDH